MRWRTNLCSVVVIFFVGQVDMAEEAMEDMAVEATADTAVEATADTDVTKLVKPKASTQN